MHGSHLNFSKGADRRRPAVIAIPAKDEEERIVACLQSVSSAIRIAAAELETLSVVVLVNNSSDATEQRASDAASHLPCPVLVQSVTLPPDRAHAGAARRLAADRAAALVEPLSRDGCLFVTDADTRVDPDWLICQARAFDGVADVIAGFITIDPEDMIHWPAELRRRQNQESCLFELLSRLGAWIDPDPLQPLPHDHASGASLGATISAYRRAGGIPEIPVGEDRAFVAQAKRAGCQVRHDRSVAVTTSGRLIGRAPGGAADTISHRASDAGALCDDRLETANASLRRAMIRRDLRRLHAGGHLGHEGWTDVLQSHLGPVDMPDALRLKLDGAPAFQSAWQLLEDGVRELRRIPLRPDHLEAEISRARYFLRALRSTKIIAPCAIHPDETQDDVRMRACAQMC